MDEAAASTAEAAMKAEGEDHVEGDEEEEVEDEEESLEKLQEEIARMEEEAARLSQETKEISGKMAFAADGSTAAAVDGAASAQQQAAKDACSVYVGQVDYSTTPEELLAHFGACGTIERVTIVCDKFTGKPKGTVLNETIFFVSWLWRFACFSVFSCGKV